MILAFEDVALLLRRAQANGLVARFIVAEPFAYERGDHRVSMEAGEEITTRTVPAILGWVSLGLQLRQPAA